MRKFKFLTLLFAALLVSGSVWGKPTQIAAKIGSTEYSSLDDAIADANTLAAGGADVTIVIVNKAVFVEGYCGFDWEINESMTIDLNGQPISIGTFAVANGKVLTFIDSSEGDGYFDGPYNFVGQFTFQEGIVLNKDPNGNQFDCDDNVITASYFNGKLVGCTAEDQNNGSIIFHAAGGETNCTINGSERKMITSLDKIPDGTTSITFDADQSLTLPFVSGGTNLSGIVIDLGGNTVQMATTAYFEIGASAVTIKNGALSGNAGDLISMTQSSSLTLNNVAMTNSKTSESYTITLVEGSSVSFTGTTPVEHALYSYNKSVNVTIGNGSTVTLTNGKLWGNSNDLTLTNNGTLNICGGTYQGTVNQSSIVGTVNKTCEGGSFSPSYQEAFFPEKVATVNGQGQYSLAAALAEAAKTANSTIALYKDVTLLSTLAIAIPVTFDLGGFDMTLGDNYISISKNVTLQNGTIKNVDNLANAATKKYAIRANGLGATISLGSKLTFDYPKYAIEEYKSANVNIAEGVTAQVAFVSGQGTDLSQQIAVNNSGTLYLGSDNNNAVLNNVAITNNGTCVISAATEIGEQISFAGAGLTTVKGGKYQNATISGTASVEGGYFKLADKTWLDNNLADGYTYERTLLNNVEVYQVALTNNFVAKVGDYKYTTLAAAFATVPDNVKTELIILQNCEATNIQVSSSKDVVLKIGTYTISNTENATTPIFDVAGSMEIEAEAISGVYNVGFNGNKGSVIKMSGEADVIVNGGKFISNAVGSSGNICSIFNVTGGDLTINNGIFIGSPLNDYQGSIIEARSNKADITINGGEFSAVSEVTAAHGQSLIWFAPNASAGSTLTITDGIFTISRDKTVYSGNENFSCLEALGQYNTLLITGGTFTNATDVQYIYPGHEGYVNALMVYNNFKSVTIKNALFKSYGKAAWIYAQETGLEKVDIKDASFISQAHRALDLGLHKNGQEVNIAGGSYAGTCGIFMGGKAEYTSTITISDCSINATEYGIAIASTNSNAVISGGTIVGEQQGIHMEAQGTLNICGPASIEGGQYAIYNNNASSSVSVSSGRFKATDLDAAVTYNAAGTFVLTGGVYNIAPVVDSSVEGFVTLGEGLAVITNPDPVTYAMGYIYAIGRAVEANITTNSSSTATTDWATNTTWVDDNAQNIVPTISDDVEIPTGKDVVVGLSGHTDAVANSIVNLGELTVKTGNSLTVSEILTVQNEAQQGGEIGKVTVEAGARLIVGDAEDVDTLNIILEDDGTNGTGAMLFNPETELDDLYATVELYTTAKGQGAVWNYIGIPLQFEGSEVFTSENWKKPAGITTYFQSWDIVEGWKTVTALSQLVPHQGFALTNNSENGGAKYTFKGKLVGNGNMALNFTHKGYSFFANSYTAPIDVKTMLDGLSSNVKATIYMFDSENNKFLNVSKADFKGFKAPKFRTIPIMNGFFILMDEQYSSAEGVNYATSVYNCNLPNSPLNAPARVEATPDFSRVRINVTDQSGRTDEMYLIECDEFTPAFENGYDVVKRLSTSQANIYATTNYGKQADVFSNEIDGTVIGFGANAKDVVYTMTFDEVQGTMYSITDLVTNTTTVMGANHSYTFTAEANSFMDARFMVRKIQNTPTDMVEVMSEMPTNGIYTVTGQFVGDASRWETLPKGAYIFNGQKVIK